MRASAQRAVLLCALPFLSFSASAEEPPDLRIVVLVEEGVDAEREPVDEALRRGAGLRSVGPVDRPAPRGSAELRAMGESLDVALLVVLARREGRTVLRVFEVDRGAYFEGNLGLPSDPETIRSFVDVRARTSRARTGSARDVAPGDGSTLRLWAGIGVLVLAAGAFAALLAFGGSEEAPDSVRVDVVR